MLVLLPLGIAALHPRVVEAACWGRQENSPDPNDPDAASIVDLSESQVEPDPAYQDDVPVETEDPDEDARRAGGSR